MTLKLRKYEFNVQTPTKPVAPLHEDVDNFYSKPVGDGEWQCYIHFVGSRHESLVVTVMEPIVVLDVRRTIVTDKNVDKHYPPVLQLTYPQTDSSTGSEQALVSRSDPCSSEPTSIVTVTPSDVSVPKVEPTQELSFPVLCLEQNGQKDARIAMCRVLSLRYNEDSVCSLHPDEKWVLSDENFDLYGTEPKSIGLDYECPMCSFSRREGEYAQILDPIQRRDMLKILGMEKDDHMKKWYTAQRSTAEQNEDAAKQLRITQEMDKETLAQEERDRQMYIVIDASRKAKQEREHARLHSNWAKEHDAAMDESYIEHEQKINMEKSYVRLRARKRREAEEYVFANGKYAADVNCVRHSNSTYLVDGVCSYCRENQLLDDVDVDMVAIKLADDIEFRRERAALIAARLSK